MGRPREHDDDTGEQLLGAAEELLADGGPDAVSVRAVADAVGTTTRAVYTVFGSKDGLLQALATRGYLLLAGWLDALPVTDDPVADLRDAGTHGFRRFALERPHLFRLTFERLNAGVTMTPTVMPAALVSYEALARRIRRAQEANGIAAGDEVEVAFAFHSLCLGLATSELSRMRPPVGASFWPNARHLDLEAVWRNALDSLLAGMAPQKPAARRTGAAAR